jgi:hypothetical protein
MQVASSPLSVVHRPLKLLFEIKHQRATSRGLCMWQAEKNQRLISVSLQQATGNLQQASGNEKRTPNNGQLTTDTLHKH